MGWFVCVFLSALTIPLWWPCGCTLSPRIPDCPLRTSLWWAWVAPHTSLGPWLSVSIHLFSLAVHFPGEEPSDFLPGPSGNKPAAHSQAGHGRARGFSFHPTIPPLRLAPCLFIRWVLCSSPTTFWPLLHLAPVSWSQHSSHSLFSFFSFTLRPLWLLLLSLHCGFCFLCPSQILLLLGVLSRVLSSLHRHWGQPYPFFWFPFRFWWLTNLCFSTELQTSVSTWWSAGHLHLEFPHT